MSVPARSCANGTVPDCEVAPSEQVREIDRQSVEQKRLDPVGVLNGTVVGSILEDTVAGVDLHYTGRR